MSRRVVITGAGIVSTLGDSPASLHEALCAGRRAPGCVELDPKHHLGARNTRPLDRIALLVTVASSLALRDSGWSSEDLRRRDIGLAVGTVFSSVRTICEFDRRALAVGPEYASPLDFANTVLNAAAGQAAIWHGLRGPNATIAAGIPSGLQAIAYAAGLIANGSADVVLAGGAEELSPECLAGLEATGSAVALGEGAALVMLETEQLAGERGANVRAVVRGYSTGCHDGAATIAAALDDAGATPEDLDVVSVSASGRAETDLLEARALERACRTRTTSVPVLAVKAGVGETLGAGAALQLVAVLEAARTSRLPGVPGAVEVSTALVVSFGWEANCCAMVIGIPKAAKLS